MMTEPWMQTMRKMKSGRNPPQDVDGAASFIGILSFELANAMTRAVHLYRSLSDGEVSLLRHRILSSSAIRSLVSPHESHLLTLALAEKLDDLNRVAAVASRLGRRCSLPALQGFEHVYSDLLVGLLDPSSIGFLSRDMTGTVRKMERFAASTTALYAELEALAELEHSVKKLTSTSVNEQILRALDQRIHCRRQDVKQLRSSSLWNQSYDKVVLLLACAVCTIHSRILQVFRDSIVELENLSVNESRQLSGLQFRPGSSHKTSPHCISNPGKLFMEYLSLCSPSSRLVTHDIKARMRRPITILAPSSTLGGSSLALHYANIVIVIEKLLNYPHLVGEEAKDGLYRMLPESLRLGLRKSLKCCVKDLTICDATLAHAWKEAIGGTLSWLSPMAHDTARWQAEHRLEQQRIAPRGNVLLLQTLYFVDRGKAEAAICELLVGLSYICRHEQQQMALLDCSSSADFNSHTD